LFVDPKGLPHFADLIGCLFSGIDLSAYKAKFYNARGTIILSSNLFIFSLFSFIY